MMMNIVDRTCKLKNTNRVWTKLLSVSVSLWYHGGYVKITVTHHDFTEAIYPVPIVIPNIDQVKIPLERDEK
jgi:hypothetical protein